MEAVNCQELTFTYPLAAEPSLQAVSFSVRQGEICLLTGRSAAGKSTLLKLLKKEIAPAGTVTGTVQVSGMVGYVSQHIEESLVCDRVRSELSFGLTNLGRTADEIALATAEIASYFHLENKLDCPLSELSGGEKQLVNLAAVMVMQPSILLLDEPCAQLDPVAAERFLQAVERLNRDFRCTVLLSEHSLPAVFEMADSVLLLEEGRLLYAGEKEAVVRELLQKEPVLRALLPVQYRVALAPTATADQPTTVDGDVALQAKHLYFAYERGNDVLRDLSLRVFRGKINAVIGANGCGKSTLLKVLSGIKKPYRGKCKTTGRVAMLTQNVYDLFTQDRCADEVPFGALTDFLSISHLAERHPYDLSGGEAQRLALAKVLAREADLILLDEPTKGLDALLKRKLAHLLRQLCQQGKTVLLVSHDLDFVGEVADAVSFMSRGNVLSTGTAPSVFRSLRFYTTSLARLTDGKIIALRDDCDEA
ncbi:MAG: ATP-binding cassette domain-containing protein [Eubacterium sp.]|nr:ATP-binding cassette domain-containing protein [Eubacterium sp.]